MGEKVKTKKNLITLVILFPIILCVVPTRISAQTLFINLSTNKQIFKIGENVILTGNVTLNNQPVYDALVAIQINKPDNTPYIIRTKTTGQNQNSWPAEILELYTCDYKGEPKNNFTRNTIAYIRVTYRNNQQSAIYAILTIYIQYSTASPYKVIFPLGETPFRIDPQKTESITSSFEIPSNAPYGNTTIYANLYSQMPINDGYPYCPEKTTTFTIVTTSPIQPPEQQNPPNFEVKFSLSMAAPGSYSVYATTRYNGIQVSNTMTFPVLPQAVPPKADFIYSPSTVGVNLTVTFDASPSLPQGFNDVIIAYEWNFGDGTPPIKVNGTPDNPPNPTITHVFLTAGNYTVTLKVTDNEGLSDQTSKIITVYKVIPPTANFIWSPQIPIVDRTITFDAGLSKPGWNGKEHPPIIRYTWDFGDGYMIDTTNSITYHTYQNPNNYTVILTVTDSDGMQNSTAKIVTVLPPPPQGSPDVDGNGRVDMTDVVIVLDAFGSTPGKPNWNPVADINRDDKIDMTDIIIVLDNFGKYV